MRTVVIDNRDFSRYVADYRQEVTRNYGFYSASWNLEGSRDELQLWFRQLLNAGVNVYDSGVMFQGKVAEMTLTLDERPVTVTMLKDFYNKVKVIFRTPFRDAAVQETEWYTNEESVQTFGLTFEYIYRPKPLMVGENADKLAEWLLSVHSYPRKIRGRVRKGAEDGLSMTIVGNYYYANMLHEFIPPAPDEVEPEDVPPVLVTDHVLEIMRNSPFMVPGQIDVSTAETQIVETNLQDRYAPAWERLQELAELAAVEGHPYTVEMWEDGRVDFLKEPNQPVYFFENGTYGDLPSNSRPGMARDNNDPLGVQGGTYYLSSADYRIETVEYSDRNGVELVPGVLDDDALIAALANAS